MDATLISPALSYRLEKIEADAFADVYRCAGPGDPLGLQLHAAGETTVMAAPGTDVLFFNRALGLGLGAMATEAELDAVCAAFEAAGSARYLVKVSPAAEPPALYGWLAARGFRYHNSWMKLYRSTDDLPEARTDLRIEQAGAEYGEAFARLIAPTFDWPEAAQGPLARTVGRPGWRHYLAFDPASGAGSDEPVAAAAMFVSEHGGYLGPAVTRESHRGRGVQSAFIARRLRDAAALGLDLVAVETAEETAEQPVVQSLRNFRRLGFKVAYVRPNYLRER